VIASIVAIVALAVVCGVLLRDNRRLTNLVIAKNPEAVIAAERVAKRPKKERDDKPHSAWANPSEAVGP
jgi:hypothetical protein